MARTQKSVTRSEYTRVCMKVAAARDMFENLTVPKAQARLKTLYDVDWGPSTVKDLYRDVEMTLNTRRQPNSSPRSRSSVSHQVRALAGVVARLIECVGAEKCMEADAPLISAIRSGKYHEYVADRDNYDNGETGGVDNG